MNPAYPPSEDVINQAAEAIRHGEVVAYPTETLYGLGADATSYGSIRRLFDIKRRPADMPSPVIASDMDMVREIVENITPKAMALINEFWPGPMTLVFDARRTLPETLTAGTGTVGIRIPSSDVARRLVETAGGPITATSANISGGGDPSDPDMIKKQLGEHLAMVIDVGKLEGGPGSTVVDARGDSLVILREGVIPASQVRAAWHAQ